MTQTIADMPALRALDELGVGETGTVSAVATTAEFAARAGLDLTRRLMEIGFIPGERLRVLHRGFPGGEPIAVKIGHSTFALRRFEAALISVSRHENRG